jgi:hypothetical protein
MSHTSFIRTPPGLSNQATFLDVDLVIFAEGGATSFSFDEVEQGADNGETPDVAFWRAVIEVFSQQTKTFHVKSVGSKVTVRAIADLIVAGSTKKVVAAMDKDLDDLRLTQIVHTNVLYTRGYSWENDVWSEETATAVLKSIVPERNNRKVASDQIRAFFDDLESTFASAVRLDRALAVVNAEPLLRESLEDTVRPAPPAVPVLRRSDLASLLRDTRSNNRGLRRHHKKDEILKDLHGHTLAKAVVHMLRTIIQTISNHKLSNALTTSMALTEFARNPNGPSIASYRQNVQQIVW